MNYLHLINGFWRRDIEYSFSGNETKLFFFLIKTCNELRWKKPFALADADAARMCKLSVNTLKTARTRLHEAGLIDYREGRQGNPKVLDNKAQYVLIDIDNPADYQNLIVRDDEKTLSDSDNQNLRVSKIDSQNSDNDDSDNQILTVRPPLSLIKNLNQTKQTNDSESEGARASPFKPPTLEEVEEYAQMTGVSLENARAFWNHYMGVGWKTGLGQQIESWQHYMQRWKYGKPGESNGSIAKQRTQSTQQGSAGVADTADRAAEFEQMVKQRNNSR